MAHNKNDEDLINTLQSTAFDFFFMRTDPETGLVPDTSRPGSPASIAAVGFALSVYPIAVERGWITREKAVSRVLATMKFFYHGPKSSTFKTIGHRGFCYHFLDMKTGKRAWDSELSTIDTTLLLAGMFTAMRYFTRRTKDETQIRQLGDKFYRRIDWHWALNGGDTLAMSWKPGKGFEAARWQGYNEGLIMYVLAMGSPTYPLDLKHYQAWARTYEWLSADGIQYLYAAPLFIHHFSHAWVDFRKIKDDFMREKKSDYFENSRLASLLQQRYAMKNEHGFKGYGEYCWGISAGDGPVNRMVTAKHKRFRTLGYAARGAPFARDDGTLSTSAVLGSIPFTPELTLKTIRHIQREYPDVIQNDHTSGGFNPSLVDKKGRIWISDAYYALDQGIIMLMIENYRSQMIWKLMRGNPYLVAGLRKAGFTGGWLGRK